MALTTASASHLDHGLTAQHIAFILAVFAEKNEFFIATLTLPEELSPLDCALYGPVMGDEPIPEEDVTYGVRGTRKCATRFVARPMRKTRMLTVIAGPHEDKPCVLYTAYGGPSAPREPGDLDLSSWEKILEARAFWKDHALAKV